MNVLDKFYDYQLEAFEATKNANKGIICMPTGTGKTFVQAGIVADDIVNNPGFRLYVINAPRIMLSFQLMKEVQKFLLMNKIQARYMAVHSARVEDDEEILELENRQDWNHGEIVSTTSAVGVAEMISTARKQDLPLVIFSTYHSADRIEMGREYHPEINIVLNDEAHFLVEDRFYPIIDNLTAERQYFFTATTRETASEEGRGMNNVDSYGEKLYVMTPREAIDRGKMVRPRMHFVTKVRESAYTQDDVDNSLGNLIVESFKQHDYTLTGTDAPKMLIASNGTSDIRKIINSTEVERLQRRGVLVYAVASDPSIGNNINGERVSRGEFLARLKEDGSDSTKSMIIIHYDILSEGIDVPGITGVLFLRAMKQSKFIQTFGRAARLDTDDRAAFESGKYGPNDLHLMDKPYAYAIVPSLTTSDSDMLAQIGELIHNLRDYGFNPSEDVMVTDTASGIGTVDGEDAVPELMARAPHIGEYIERVQAEIEDERIASLSNAAFIDELLNISL